MRIAIETGTHLPWVSRLLEECGHEVLVANARKTRLIYAKKRAAVAVARKLCVHLQRLWITGEIYDPLYNTHRRQEKEEAA